MKQSFLRLQFQRDMGGEVWKVLGHGGKVRVDCDEMVGRRENPVDGDVDDRTVPGLLICIPESDLRG
jgi:hypothetical protein